MKPYYQDDAVTLYHGDCRDVLPTLGTECAALLLTDPPYGIAFATNHAVRGKGATWMNTVIAGDDSTEARDHVLAWWGAKSALVFGSWKRPVPVGTRAVLIWDKGPASGMGDLSLPWKGSWESIYVLGSGFIGSRDEGVIKGFTGITWESAGRWHPNDKPVKLLRYLLSKHAGGSVLDPFSGAGSTLRAAKDLGRRAIGIELDERYCEIAARRMAQSVMPLGEAAS